MNIFGVKDIIDDGEFVSISTISGSIIHLPSQDKHSIVVESWGDHDIKVHVDWGEG